MWEYKTVILFSKEDWTWFNTIRLKELGKEGWELCSILQDVKYYCKTAYFKRFIKCQK